jgi:hypothetical protein
MARQPARCGTLAGYDRHRRAGEATCAACKDAKAIYNYDRTTARNRALKRLAAEYPERFRELLAEEHEAVAAENEAMFGPEPDE